jgi:hypothetical protein
MNSTQFPFFRRKFSVDPKFEIKFVIYFFSVFIAAFFMVGLIFLLIYRFGFDVMELVMLYVLVGVLPLMVTLFLIATGLKVFEMRGLVRFSRDLRFKKLKKR